MFNLLLIVAGILYLVYYLMTRNYTYWKKRGVPGPEPKFLIGNFKSVLNKKIHLVHELDELYKEWKGKTDVLGIFSGGTPALMILDSGILKRIMITDFSHFADQPTNQFGVDKHSDPLMGRNPFFLKGEEWKEKRAEILPAFTSGRIKALFPIMQEVAGRMKHYIKNEMPSQGSFEAYELCGKFTTDVVASSIYGVESGAFTDENSRIRQIAKLIFTPSFNLFFVTNVAPYFPFLAKLIKVKLCPDELSDFLINLLKQAIDHRLTSKVQRQDFLDFLIHLREKKGLTELEVAAHTVTFFFDGIETSKTTLSNVFYELAKKKSVQEKLRLEMLRIRSPDKTFEYDTLTENKYLEQVINESLRLHPVLTSHSRECIKECSIKLANGKTLTVEKGTSILIPVYSVHRDPNHYGPDANEFNPERFNDENGGLKMYKDKEVLFPFGDGPRICLGQRFALAQMKCCIANILTSFEISVSEKMSSKPQFDTMQTLLLYKEGVWLKFKEINV